MVSSKMDSATISSMCRCCAAEGIFKDIKTSYHWMGEEEVYGDMLRECFDVKLISVEEGGICEVCITQLRNASNFKKQVLHTEKKFKRLLDSRRFNTTEVKEELSGEENSTSDDNDNDRDVDNDNIDDEDYVPEFEMPIKTESADDTKSRKRAAKASTSRAKKSRLADDEDKSIGIGHTRSIKLEVEEPMELNVLKAMSIAYSDKVIQLNDKNKLRHNKKSNAKKMPDKPLTKPKPVNLVVSQASLELSKHRKNIRTILQYSNATPIRSHSIGSGYICCFCNTFFPKAADLKTHTIQDHDSETRSKYKQKGCLNSFIVKLDITSLRCSICSTPMDKLEQLVDHLNNTHAKKLHTDIKSHIVCFKLDREAMRCHICSAEFNSFKQLLEHMNRHFTNFICDECGAGFINRNQLLSHSEKHKKEAHKCPSCDKVFPSATKMKSHARLRHDSASGAYKCSQCGDKFTKKNARKEHMVKAHGVKYSEYKCEACGRSFRNNDALRIHRNRDHLMERRYQCQICDSRFFTSFILREHQRTHTGERDFKCSVCGKLFTRKFAMQTHMRSHTGDRRFGCDHCDMRFLQKCSLKSHLRSRHAVELP